MRYSNSKGVLTAVIAAVTVLFATAQKAKAVFEMQLTDGTAANTVTLVDTNGTGVLSYDGKIGNFSINVTTGLSKPALPAQPPQLDLNSVDVTSSLGGGTLYITLEDTGFTTTLPSPFLQSSIGGTLGNGTSLTFQSWVNNSAKPDLSNPYTGSAPAGSTGTPLLSFGPGGLGFSGTADSGTLTTLSSPFNMFATAVLTASGGQEFASFDGTTEVLPVPSTLVLVLSGLPLLGLCPLLGLPRKRKLSAA